MASRESVNFRAFVRGAVNLSTAALREAKTADPPYILSTPKLRKVPSDPGDSIHRRVHEAGNGRQRRNGVKMALPTIGQLALYYLRYTIAGEVAEARSKFGGLRAMLTSLADLMELSLLPSMEIESKFEEARIAAWVRFGRARGYVEVTRNEFVVANRDRIGQCIHGQ